MNETALQMIMRYIGALIFIGPLCSLVALSIVGFTPLRARERLVKRIVAVGQSVGFFSALAVVYQVMHRFFVHGRIEPIEIINRHLFEFGHHSVIFALQIDAINIWFVLMAMVLSNIVGVFSQHYLHRDVGFFRFFFLIVLFLNGVLIVFMANTFQVLFMGWEVVGITSALLISFFTVRRQTIDNALHAFWAYRVSDVGLLCAAILVAAFVPNQVFSGSHGELKQLPESLATLVPFLLLFSAMGKSAQFPYSSWLPRAMEGPTSSSAIFYGGLSIHAGVYLLLRLRMEYQVPTSLLIVMAAVGLISCLYGALLSQVQSDVKSALAYASLSQVGIMFVEISLGWYYIATIHCLGHAFLRTYQILKCSSIIHQFVSFDDAHQNDAERVKARLLPILMTRSSMSRLFSFSFDLALRAASGPSELVSFLERASMLLQRLEERWLRLLSTMSRR